MKTLTTPFLAIALMAASPAFADDCEAPEAPTLPDGSSASMEEMVAGQGAIKAFQAESGEYRTCLDTEIAAAQKRVKKGDEDDKAEAAAAFEAATEAYNASVATEEKLAEDFNTAIRAFKAANP
ncbi:hypothetical protein NOR51B_1102 [Luminiphilus syltensis NOR5-1B]|uniref:Uncharacterized protein n=1 Tax=Luminiphilus syltensis NOR5-1B TaxID=565045 RepID=B8KUB9_9GAMM|nr:hypothetical protein [Luminiphilus syltensis]EED35157.1 hypothetical protein NOR51B_1102 [Luminiphilus syltensis NOR5-1B]